MNEERPPRLWWAMWKRFLIGGVLVVALSFAATLTVALNTATSIAEKVFRNTIVVPKGLVTPVYSGGPQTFLVLGSVYVNVDHRYYHVNGIGAENYSEINLQPGYQKLCYQNALSYVRYRHGDSDFVRVARQQDFLRDLREQISPSDVIGQLEPVAKAVGRAIVSTFKRSHEELFTLAKLIAFSQGKPLRQVKFRALNVNAQLRGGSFVTTTPALAQATLRDFQFGRQKVSLPHAAIVRAKRSSRSRKGSRHATP